MSVVRNNTEEDARYFPCIGEDWREKGVDPPIGFDWANEFRPPVYGDYFLSRVGHVEYSEKDGFIYNRHILKKVCGNCKAPHANDHKGVKIYISGDLAFPDDVHFCPTCADALKALEWLTLDSFKEEVAD